MPILSKLWPFPKEFGDVTGQKHFKSCQINSRHLVACTRLRFRASPTIFNCPGGYMCQFLLSQAFWVAE